MSNVYQALQSKATPISSGMIVIGVSYCSEKEAFFNAMIGNDIKFYCPYIMEFIDHIE